MLGALGLSLAFLAGQGSPAGNPVAAPGGWNVVGQTTILGRPVPIAFPPSGGPYDESTPHLSWGGAKYAVGADGTLQARYLTDGGWGDAAQLFQAARAAGVSRAEYPVKVVLVTRCELLELGGDGTWRVRRGVIERFQVDRILLALAQAKGLVEAASGGRYDVSYRVTLDNDLVVEQVSAADPGGDLFGAEFLAETVAARFNDDAFEADDGVYRGPFSGVVVIHAGLVSDVRTWILGDTPVTTVPYYGFSDRSASDALGIQLFEVLRRQAALNAQRYGAAVGDSGSVRSGRALPTYPGVADRTLTGIEAERGNRATLPRDAARPWTPARPATVASYTEADAASDPLGRVGSAGDVTAELTGAPIQESEQGDRRWWFVRPDIAPMVTALVGGQRAVGVATDPTPGSGRRAVVFDVTDRPGATMWLRLGPTLAPVFPPPSEGPQQQVSDMVAVGDFRVEAVPGDPQGAVWRLTLEGLTTRGYVTVVGKPDGRSLLDGWRDPVVRFKARTSSPEPFAVSFVGADGEVKGAALLGGTLRIPAEFTGQPPVARAAPFPADGGWHDIAIRVRDLVGEQPVHAIRVGPVPFGQFYERASLGTAGLDMTPLTLEEAFEGVPSLPGLAADPRLAELAVLAGELDDVAWARLQELVRADDLTVRLNAIAALGRVTRPEALATLGVQSRSGENMIAFLASRLLGAENTPGRRASLVETVQRGPFDTNRRFAAEVMAPWEDVPSSTSLAALLAAESWRTRAAGARALAGVPSREAGILQISFLHDVEPQVRLAVTEGADTRLELSGRRLIFGAVNDPSEAVRLASLRRLIEGPDSAFRREALRTLRDESLSVRVGMVRALAGLQSETARPALRAAVVDVSPIVRAAALDAFASLPDGVQPAEVQNTFGDSDPRVQFALIGLARAKGLTLPGATVRAMRQSADPEVAKLAEALPEGP